MKTLITGLLLTLSIGASALEVEVYSKTHNKKRNDFNIQNERFKVNPRSEAVTIEFTLWSFDRTDEDGGFDTTIKRSLDGLYFERSSGDILYNNTVCATTRLKRGIFGTKRKIYLTGRCTLNAIKDSTFDNNRFGGVNVKNRIGLYMDVL